MAENVLVKLFHLFIRYIVTEKVSQSFTKCRKKKVTRKITRVQRTWTDTENMEECKRHTENTEGHVGMWRTWRDIENLEEHGEHARGILRTWRNMENTEEHGGTVRT